MIKQPTKGYLKDVELKQASIDQIVLLLKQKYDEDEKPLPPGERLKKIAERLHRRHHPKLAPSS